MPWIGGVVVVMQVSQRLGEGRRPLSWVEEDEPTATTAIEASPARRRDVLNLLTFAERTAVWCQPPRPESESIIGDDELSSCIASRNPREQAGFATRRPAASSRSN